MIDIRNFDKAEVLKVLYDASHHQGLGFMSAVRDEDVTVEHCRELLASGKTYFNYLYGKVMKIDLSGDSFDERLYDRDNGIGAAQRAINRLRKPDTRHVGCAIHCVIPGVLANLNCHVDGFDIRFENRDAYYEFLNLVKQCKRYYE